LEKQAAPTEAPDAEWDREYEQQLSAWAMDQVRPEFQETTWQAFHRTAVLGQGPKDVAAALGLSPGAVYVAKSRVLARLRDVIRRIQDD
jgi:RNA polymerase sigma-70 factor (ECF subfamily)